MSAKKKSDTGRLVLMRRFMLNRLVDKTGDGTGTIAEGIMFSNGKCAVARVVLTESVEMFETVEEMQAAISRDGKTQVEWID